MCYRGRGWGGVRNPPRSRGGARLVKLIYSVLIRNRLHVIVFLLLLLPSSVALFFALPVTSKIFVHYNLQGFIVPPAINIFENRRLFEEFFLHLIMPLEKDVFFLSFFIFFLSLLHRQQQTSSPQIRRYQKLSISTFFTILFSTTPPKT